MEARLKSLVTLLALGVMLLAAALWGWAAISEPLPERAGPAVCVDRPFASGDPVRRADVTVSVLNAGTRTGLAGLTLDLFVDAGFAQGTADDAPEGSRVRAVEIWTEDPTSPAVRLVEAHLGDAVKVVRQEPTVSGVQVVVGDRFQNLVKGPRKVVAESDVEVCGPPDVT
jgi:hypothetical protein